jgi:hypothetical protein
MLKYCKSSDILSDTSLSSWAVITLLKFFTQKWDYSKRNCYDSLLIYMYQCVFILTSTLP